MKIDAEIRRSEMYLAKLRKLARLRTAIEQAEETVKLAEKQDELEGKIVALVCAHYERSLAQLRLKSRTADLVWPRFTAFYLLRERYHTRIVHLAEMFGLDHTSVSYGVKTARNRMAVDGRYRAVIDGLNRKIDEMISGNLGHVAESDRR